jgi:hypothetical protein
VIGLPGDCKIARRLRNAEPFFAPCFDDDLLDQAQNTGRCQQTMTLKTQVFILPLQLKRPNEMYIRSKLNGQELAISR